MTEQSNFILWDVDGVLVWYHPFDPSCDWRKYLLKEKLLEPWEAFQRSSAWRTCLKSKQENTIWHLEHFLAYRNENPANANKIVDIWLQNNIEPNTSMIEKLKIAIAEGHKCAIASNQDGLRGKWLNFWLDNLGLDIPRFISSEIDSAKPEESFFSYIESTLGGQKRNFLLIDDTTENLHIAGNRGWRTIHYTPSPDRQADKNSQIVRF